MNKAIYLDMSILDNSKMIMYKICMITLNQSIGIKQNYVKQILIALFFIS